jgi:hypothetical protein
VVLSDGGRGPQVGGRRLVKGASGDELAGGDGGAVEGGVDASVPGGRDGVEAGAYGRVEVRAAPSLGQRDDDGSLRW